MFNAPQRLFWTSLLGIAAVNWASPATAFDASNNPAGAAFIVAQEEADSDADFEQHAAELRQWLQQREEERRRNGMAFDEMPEEIVTPPLAGRKQHTLKLTRRGILAKTKSHGRQRHVLGHSRPAPSPGARQSKHGKPARPR